MTDPSFTERMQKLQGEMKERRAAGYKPSGRDRVVGGLWLLALLAFAVAIVFVVAFVLIESAGIILNLVGAIAVVLVASAAWRKIRS